MTPALSMRHDAPSSRWDAPGVRLSSLVAFMVPGLALWLPSGYSYGAALLVLCALLGSPLWLRRSWLTPPVGWLMVSIGALGAVWLLDASAAEGWRSLDKPSRYLVVLPCLGFLLVFPPRPAALFLGVAVGACGAGLKAMQDVWLHGLDRAWSPPEAAHNAIQYGNLSALLGLMCWLMLLMHVGRWRVRTLVALGVCGWLGLLGSLLSQSRGGWLALAVSLPLWVWLASRWLPVRRMLQAGALVLVAVAVLVAFKAPEIQRRFTEARAEAALYQTQGNAHSSVGQRLDHWQLAWQMGLDKPLTGWGQAGYLEEKKRRVAAGQAHPFVLEFSHAHNEVLDLFVKHGLPGVLALLLFYAVPAWLFWPAPARQRFAAEDTGVGVPDPTALTLRLLGLSLPVLYAGFGLTQVFLAHNSGNLFYLFMTVLVFGALQGRMAAHPGG